MSILDAPIKHIDSSCCGSVNQTRKNVLYSTWIWIFTFLIYTSYHQSRKPISVVKNVLNQNCSGLVPDHETNDTDWCKWPPFDKENSQSLLGGLDSAFLFAYAVGMFISGYIAERTDLRIFLAFGMVMSGIFTILFGVGYFLDIHVYWYFVLVQALAGLFQSSGWPGVVTAMGNWFGKGGRGLIMGIWNSHTSVGNIIGTLIAAAFVDSIWGMSFIIPGFIILILGILALAFLIPEPKVVGLPSPNAYRSGTVPRVGSVFIDSAPATEEEVKCLLPSEAESGLEDASIISPKHEEKAIGVVGALKIPGVVEFSLCLFFAKLVSYTFLYWLPNYILHNTTFDPEQSADLSVFFDVGGIVGGILAGFLRDRIGVPASICAVMLIIAIPLMFVYQYFSGTSLGLNIFLLLVVGLLVNGPYSLITTAVSADLGTHPCLKGNSKALATVTSIIDGTGSIGAAVGPLMAGPISSIKWDYVFYMLMIADVFSLLFLIRLVVREVKSFHRPAIEDGYVS